VFITDLISFLCQYQISVLTFIAILLYCCRRVCDWKWKRWCSVWTSRVRIRRSCKPYWYYECSPSWRAICLSLSSTRTFHSNVSTHSCSFGESQKQICSDCRFLTDRKPRRCASHSADSSDIMAFTARFYLIIVKDWLITWLGTDVINQSLVDDPTALPPGFNLPRHPWANLNHFRTGQGQCAANLCHWHKIPDPWCHPCCSCGLAVLQNRQWVILWMTALCQDFLAVLLLYISLVMRQSSGKW